MSRPSACEGRDQITEGMKTWQEDSIKLENECIFLHSAVDLKEAQIEELQRDHAALAEKCKKHDEETARNDQRAGQSSETRIPQLRIAMSRPSACEGRDQITEGMKTWQEDSIKLENECIFLRSAVDLKEAQIEELQRDHAALAEKCKKHDEVMSQKDADVKRFGDENAALKGKLKKIEDLMRDKESEVTKLQVENAALKEKCKDQDAISEELESIFFQMLSLHKKSKSLSTKIAEKYENSSTSERKGQKRTAREMMDYPATKSQRSKKKARQAESSDDCQVEQGSGGEEESFAGISTLGHLDSDVSQNSAV